MIISGSFLFSSDHTTITGWVVLLKNACFSSTGHVPCTCGRHLAPFDVGSRLWLKARRINLAMSGVLFPGVPESLLTSELETPHPGKSSLKSACKQSPTPDQAKKMCLNEPVLKTKQIVEQIEKTLNTSNSDHTSPSGRLSLTTKK